MSFNNSPRAQENFVVAKVGQTTIPNSGTLSNTSTGAVNLADGQLGFVADSIWGSVAMNAFTDATPTILESPVLAIYQGNENSSNPGAAQQVATYPLWARPFERTHAIDGRNPVQVTKQAFREPAHSVWVTGKPAGDAAEINVLDLTEYELSIAFRGRRVEEMYGREQAASFQASVTTPDFTALGKTEAEGRSWLLHNLGWNINRNSKAFSINSRFPSNTPVVAFLIASAGGAGKAIGGGAPLAAGDTFTVVTTAAGNKTITVTEAMAASIKAAAVAATGVAIASVTWTIIPINLAAQYTIAPAAGDILMTMALDETLAFVDYIPNVKVRMQVGLTLGFDYPVVFNDELSNADEGQGQGRVLDLLYKATQGQRKYNWRHVENPVTDFPSPIDTAGKYVVYNINHSVASTPSMHNTFGHNFREIVCIPAYSSGTTPNGLIATFDGVLNSWLGSALNNNAIVAFN